METKVCKKCLNEKPVCLFYKQSRNKDGYWNSCVECEKNKYRENSDKIKLRVYEYRKNNKEVVKETKKKYYEKNRLRLLEEKKEYQQENRDKRREYLFRKYHNDINFKLTNNIRIRVRSYLRSKKINKNNKTFNIVGCSPEHLKEHLEKQFKDGMTWENYGLYGWHIDHIIPLSSAETEDEIYKLCHYTNLQPLWVEENLKKGSKIIN